MMSDSDASPGVYDSDDYSRTLTDQIKALKDLLENGASREEIAQFVDDDTSSLVSRVDPWMMLGFAITDDVHTGVVVELMERWPEAVSTPDRKMNVGYCDS